MVSEEDRDLIVVGEEQTLKVPAEWRVIEVVRHDNSCK
jgi:hypothetical protein